MRSLKLTKQYVKSLKIARKHHIDEDRLNGAIQTLILGENLPSDFFDIKMEGKYSKFHECQINFEWSLVFSIEGELTLVNLFRNGSRADYSGVADSAEINRSKSRKMWDLFILFLSIYVLIELAIEIIYPFDQNTINLINTVDTIICFIFLGDFFYFIYKSDDKLDYLKKHWIDFVASIPFMTFMRFFRVVRVIRMVRLLRGIKGLIQIFKLLGTSKLHNILISYIFILILVMLYCSLAFLAFEKGLNPNVNSFFDSFWWAFVTITTTGYGDIYPYTVEGRIVGMILSIGGMGLFSLVTAQLATALIKISRKEEE